MICSIRKKSSASICEFCPSCGPSRIASRCFQEEAQRPQRDSKHVLGDHLGSGRSGCPKMPQAWAPMFLKAMFGMTTLILTITGWWFQPSWNILVNGKDYPIYYGKMFQTTNQPWSWPQECQLCEVRYGQVPSVPNASGWLNCAAVHQCYLRVDRGRRKGIHCWLNAQRQSSLWTCRFHRESTSNEFSPPEMRLRTYGFLLSVSNKKNGSQKQTKSAWNKQCNWWT